jgi:hypothetical protein
MALKLRGVPLRDHRYHLENGRCEQWYYRNYAFALQAEMLLFDDSRETYCVNVSPRLTKHLPKQHTLKRFVQLIRSKWLTLSSVPL